MNDQAFAGVATAVSILQMQLEETRGELESYRAVSAPLLLGGCPDIPKLLRVTATNLGDPLNEHDIEELLEHGLLVVSQTSLVSLHLGEKHTFLSPAEPGSVLSGLAFYSACEQRASTWRAMLSLAWRMGDKDEMKHPMTNLMVIPPDYRLTWDGKNIQVYSQVRDVDEEMVERISAFVDNQLPMFFEELR